MKCVGDKVRQGRCGCTGCGLGGDVGTLEERGDLDLLEAVVSNHKWMGTYEAGGEYGRLLMAIVRVC